MKYRIVILLIVFAYLGTINAQNNLTDNKIVSLSKMSLAEVAAYKMAEFNNKAESSIKKEAIANKAILVNLPSVVTSDQQRTSYTYDSHGNILSEIKEKKNGGAWENYTRYTYTFDANSNRLTSVFETGTGSTWVNNTRETNQYDAYSKMTSSLVENWNNGVWQSNYRHTFSYNAQHLLTLDLMEIWNGSSWVNNQRITNEYNSNNYHTVKLIENWVSQVWAGASKLTFTYDNAGNQLTYVSQNWTNNAWVNAYRNTSTYDANNNLLTSLDQTYVGGGWLNLYRSTYTYVNNALQQEVFEIWSASAWGFSFRYTFTNDTNTHTIVNLTENWSNTGWVNFHRTTTVYSVSGLMLSELSESYSNDAWVGEFRFFYTVDGSNKTTHFYGELWMNNAWVQYLASMRFIVPFQNRVYYAYGNYADVEYVAVNDINSDDVSKVSEFSLAQNYPNPFNPSTVISYSLPYESNVTLTVYNALGEVVKTFTEGSKIAGSYKVTFNAANLTSGTYFYQITATPTNGKQGFTQTKKMLLVK